ncbi:MAG TPA: hypothetical protein VIJ17_03960, partial [Pseudolabrys sp.]
LFFNFGEPHPHEYPHSEGPILHCDQPNAGREHLGQDAGGRLLLMMLTTLNVTTISPVLSQRSSSRPGGG